MSKFTPEDDRNLVRYIAERSPEQSGRSNIRLFEELVSKDNEHLWPWAQKIRARSWLNRYQTRQVVFDKAIREYLDSRLQSRHHSAPPIATLESTSKKEIFTQSDEENLVTFFATLRRDERRRRDSTMVYRDILAKHPEKYPWASTHSYSSWRDHYIANKDSFDERIRDLQPKSNETSLKRPLSPKSQSDDNIYPVKKPRLASQPNTPQRITRQSPPHTYPRYDTHLHTIPPQSSTNQQKSTLVLASSQSSPIPSERPINVPETATEPYASPQPGDPQRQSSKEAGYSDDSPPPRSAESSQEIYPIDAAATNQSERKFTISQPTKTPSVPELSEDDPFASSPPSPKNTLSVFYDPPRPRHFNAFRGESDRVRDRVEVDLSKIERKKVEKKPVFKKEEEEEEVTALTAKEKTKKAKRPVEENLRSSPSKAQENLQRPSQKTMAYSVATEPLITVSRQSAGDTKERKVKGEPLRRTKQPTTVSSSQRVFRTSKASDSLQGPDKMEDMEEDAMNIGPDEPTPSRWQATAASLADSRMASSLHKSPASAATDVEDDLREKIEGPEQDKDVFNSQEPIASTSAQDPYVLRGPRLVLNDASSIIHLSSPIAVGRKGHHHHRERDKSRRKTFAGFPSVPHIDLAGLAKRPSQAAESKSLPTRPIMPAHAIPMSLSARLRAKERKTRRATFTPPSHLRHSVTSSSYSGTPPSDRPNIPIDLLSPATTRIILQKGVEAALKELEANHGFSTVVVERVWTAQGMDLQKADETLLRMRLAAERAAEDSLDGMEEDVIDNTQKFLPTPPPQRQPDFEDQNKYTPPVRTKAFVYRRLSEHKRFKEASEQERDAMLMTAGMVGTSPLGAWTAVIDDDAEVPTELDLVEKKGEEWGNQKANNTYRRRTGMMQAPAAPVANLRADGKSSVSPTRQVDAAQPSSSTLDPRRKADKSTWPVQKPRPPPKVASSQSKPVAKPSTKDPAPRISQPNPTSVSSQSKPISSSSSSESATTPNIAPPTTKPSEPTWTAEDKQALNSQNKVELERLAKKFGRDAVRKMFLEASAKVSTPALSPSTPIWTSEDEQALRSRKKTDLDRLAEKFGSDAVRKKFLQVLKK